MFPSWPALARPILSLALAYPILGLLSLARPPGPALFLAHPDLALSLACVRPELLSHQHGYVDCSGRADSPPSERSWALLCPWGEVLLVASPRQRLLRTR